MEELMIYLLKSALCTTLFFSIYWCFLKRETFYRFNRFFLLTGILSALLLPFFQYSYTVNLEVPAALNQMINKNDNKATLSAIPFWQYPGLATYILITCFFMIRHLSGWMKINRTVRKYGHSLVGGYKIINTDVFQTSFSVFNYIFIDISADTSETERNLILEHEIAHVKQYHWADLLSVQFICAMQWFNPFAWLYLYAIKQNHEFLADAAVLQQGNSPAQYRAALINHTLKTPVFRFASSFANDDKFTRLKMMTKTSSNPLRKLTVLLLLPLLALFVLAFARADYKVTYSQKKTKTTGTSSPGESPGQRKKAILPVKTITVVSKKTATLQKTNAQQKQYQETEPRQSAPEKMTVSVSPDSLQVQTQNTSVPHQNITQLIIIDGTTHTSIDDVNTGNIESINVYKGKQATDKFGDKGKNGVIQITTKSSHP